MDIREVVGFGFQQYLVRNYIIGEDAFGGFYVKLEDVGYYRMLEFAFPNGYGASVIRTPFSYGNGFGHWEVAVLKDGEITYSTPIADDVIGFLKPQEVHDKLQLIYQLQPRKTNEEAIHNSEAQKWPSSTRHVLRRQDGGEEST